MTSRPVDRMFKAFADETRLRILHLLSVRKELCVCDIVSILGVGQSKVSRHLAYLRNAGLVIDRKEGLWIHYSLAKPEGRFHKNLVGCLGGCFGEVSVFQKDRKRLGKFGRNNGRCR